MKSLIKSILSPGLLNFLKQFQSRWFNYSLTSYSQEGEDMILRRIFETVEKGFYIDVGAHHPKRFSNTYFFYKKGWSGINIDATPGSMNLFKRIRPRDINIEAAIAKDKKELTFFIFNEPALNSFDAKLSHFRNTSRYHVIGHEQILTITLEEVLKQSLAEQQKINFLTIDVEGYDLEVLESNNWQMFRPEYILVECLGINLNQLEDNQVYNFLCTKKYNIFAKTFNTMIFKDKLLP